MPPIPLPLITTLIMPLLEETIWILSNVCQASFITQTELYYTFWYKNDQNLLNIKQLTSSSKKKMKMETQMITQRADNMKKEYGKEIFDWTAVGYFAIKKFDWIGIKEDPMYKPLCHMNTTSPQNNNTNQRTGLLPSSSNWILLLWILWCIKLVPSSLFVHH